MVFNLDDFLAKAQKANASDIHLNCNKVPSLRINGEIYKISSDVLSQDDMEKILEKTIPQKLSSKMPQVNDLDYMYEVKGVSRYRVNYCRDLNYPKLTFRAVPYKIKSMTRLNLPDVINEYVNYNNGIILVTGATGSGKTTTLASMIETINQTRKNHIITIEDPVEFVYEDKKSIVTQRSLGVDVDDFKTGLKYALRQDPDVILIGEIRDTQTLLSALEAAETGHLVFSTLHTNSTISTIHRLKGFVEESKQSEFTERLAGCIRGIIHQQLVPKKDGSGLVPANEILTFTSTVVDYIRQGKFEQVYYLMQTSKLPDLTTMNQALFQLFQKGIITKETALDFSFERVEMEQLLRGVYRNNITNEDTLL